MVQVWITVKMAFDFTGKKILVTGAGSGIGYELAIAIANAGAEVYGLSRQKEHLDKLVADCPRIIPIQVDLADWDATKKAAEKLPVLDGLVNNAGIVLGSHEAVDVTKDVVKKTMEVNVMGALNLTQVIGKKMMEVGKGGSIVNVSSILGLNPMSACIAYDMSKAALDMMTKQFALELGPKNIRVNSVNPTVVLTELTKPYWEGTPRAERLKSATPLGRFAEIHEVVGPIMFLLSEYSTMVTGTASPIDGGLMSNIPV